jgi:methionyl-tRNA formyltransferase
MPYKIVFAGTSEFAVHSLTALMNSSHQIIAVYTQPDRPSGRGLKLTPSPVKTAALEMHLPLFQPPSLREEAAQQQLAELKPDLMVVVVYGLLIPKNVLTIPEKGCINVHPSILPRWRGAAPIQRAIAAGDLETGVTIMQLDEGWDTGDILSQIHCPIYPTESSQALSERLAIVGAELLVKTIDQLEAGQIHPLPQDHAQANYASKLEKIEGELNWEESAVDLERKIRAFNPWPVAYTNWENQQIRIWQAETLLERSPVTIPPGTLLGINDKGLDVATGDGALRIIKLQLPGAKPISAFDFINSKKSLLIPFKSIFGKCAEPGA